MSIDKTVKSDKVELTTVLWFGIFKGSSPAKLIKSSNIEGIKYLLWLRNELNEKGFPRFMFSLDLHHTLDQIIRKNAIFDEKLQRYTVTDYNLWLAEKRLQKKKDEIRKEEEIKHKREEIAMYQEEQKRKDQAVRERQQAYLESKALEIAALARINEEREQAYDAAWGAW